MELMFGLALQSAFLSDAEMFTSLDLQEKEKSRSLRRHLIFQMSKLKKLLLWLMMSKKRNQSFTPWNSQDFICICHSKLTLDVKEGVALLWSLINVVFLGILIQHEICSLIKLVFSWFPFQLP